MSVTLTAPLIEAFAGTFLSPRYDDARPTAAFHREAWTLYASSHPRCEVIAPRDHAKSTALTFSYIMAEVLFRVSDYVILIGSTEEMAQEQLSNISDELHENDDLRREFGLDTFVTDSKTDIIMRFKDGTMFRILARGAEQRIRGRMWNGKRPNLIVCDDMEDDEQVENADRRSKFRRWFFRAARQALSKKGKIRVHGTILHEDSLLARLQKNSTWQHLFYKAHEGFDDFTNILWPERWTENELRTKRQEFIDDQDAAGYAQEILNDPQDNSEAYLRKDDFLSMQDQDYLAVKHIIVGCDFAVSKADRANRTSFTVGGQCLSNLLHIVDQHVGRWDTLEWIDLMFDLQEKWNPEYFFVEDGVIWKSIAPMVYKEMQTRGKWLNCYPIPSIKDKATRARSFQKRMRAGHCRFDKEAEWYGAYENELLKFTGRSEATLDDQFDSTAIIAKGLDLMTDLEEEDFFTDEEIEFEQQSDRKTPGRSVHTGY